jgi:hypothetical protein
LVVSAMLPPLQPTLFIQHQTLPVQYGLDENSNLVDTMNTNQNLRFRHAIL